MCANFRELLPKLTDNKIEEEKILQLTDCGCSGGAGVSVISDWLAVPVMVFGIHIINWRQIV